MKSWIFFFFFFFIDRGMRKRISGHMLKTKTQIRLRIHAQSVQVLNCPLTESIDTTECVNTGRHNVGRASAL